VIRYLTGGVLIRINRLTQQLEPELATSWKVLGDGKQIQFQLRAGLKFSDGTPFSAEDVVYTFRALMDPALHSPTADSFRSDAGPSTARAVSAQQVLVTFPTAIVSVERLFDELVILSARSAQKERAVLGPFFVADYKPGAQVLLKKNPFYWKRDERGRQLPYFDSVRLDIQSNRDLEMLRFRRGELDLINNLTPDLYESLAEQMPSAVRDLGPSLEGEQMWFNQVESSPLPAYKKAWFRSRNFRRAISESINRGDIARVVYLRHATPAVGPVSRANHFWFNAKLGPHPFDPPGALKKLQQDGFSKGPDGALRDRDGHPVEFSLITNAGNKSRERIGAMLQQDLKALGIKLNLVTLDFPSLIERITRSFDYEACLLGMVNVDLDPNAQVNVWLSSGESHQWNPNQKTPATPWEAEIDRLIKLQASTIDPAKRKAAFDSVQEIVWEEAPFIYLINKNALVAASPSLRNLQPAIMRPQLIWNVEKLTH
jgi:peptide/nickel transport system substrate-binding protein